MHSFEQFHEELLETFMPSDSPEEALDGAWRQAVLEQAVEAVARWFEGRGRAMEFEVWRAYDLGPAPERPTYQVLAERFAVSVALVRQYLISVRAKLRAMVIEVVRSTVGDPESLRTEIRELF